MLQDRAEDTEDVLTILSDPSGFAPPTVILWQKRPAALLSQYFESTPRDVHTRRISCAHAAMIGCCHTSKVSTDWVENMTRLLAYWNCKHTEPAQHDIFSASYT